MEAKQKNNVDPYGNFEAICGTPDLRWYEANRRIEFFDRMVGFRPTIEPKPVYDYFLHGYVSIYKEKFAVVECKYIQRAADVKLKEKCRKEAKKELEEQFKGYNDKKELIDFVIDTYYKRHYKEAKKKDGYKPKSKITKSTFIFDIEKLVRGNSEIYQLTGYEDGIQHESVQMIDSKEVSYITKALNCVKDITRHAKIKNIKLEGRYQKELLEKVDVNCPLQAKNLDRMGDKDSLFSDCSFLETLFDDEESDAAFRKRINTKHGRSGE